MKRTFFSAILISILMSSDIVLAQSSATSPQQRQELAKNMENMGACLRSSKPIEDCHNEMRKACDFMMDGMHGRKRAMKTTETKETKTPQK